jgi:cytochrome d ubiquinol oxidase subunit I
VAGELGWIVAEVGRQPWIIQDLLTVDNAVTQVTTGSVITTFILFAIMFTALLIAEVSIMLKQIKIGANQH